MSTKEIEALLAQMTECYCAIAKLLDESDDREHAVATLNRLHAELLRVRADLRLRRRLRLRYGPTAGSG